MPWATHAAPIPHPFYDEKAQGWFWKETTPEPLLRQAPPTVKAPVVPPLPLTPEDTPLTSAWFRAHLGTIRDQALDDPTAENVRRYFVLQKALLDKAERFAEMAHSVVFQDPHLDERAQRPTTPFALALNHQAENHARLNALSQMAKAAGLLFVFRSDCRFCHLMAPLVGELSQRIGMRLYAVSLDGGDLPGLPPETLFKDPGLGQTLHLTATPALLLMVPQKGLFPVLEGSASALELEAHLYETGLASGLIPSHQHSE